GVPLTEDETAKLGFAEIDFEEGDDAIEYVAPSPEFAPLGEDEVTPKGEQELVEMLTKHLVMQTQCTNYDRLAYINAFADYRRLHPKLSEEEALARFEVDSAALVQQILGGHCGGLSGDLLRSGDYGKGAYLVGSKLPNEFQQAKAPEYCHVAAMIRFQHPETAEDNGLIILEPGFNITKPIVVKKGVPGQVVVGDELWVFTLNKDCTEVVCQPQPLKDGEKWKKKKSDDKRMTYRTDRFLNPDLSLTVPFLHVDNRPQVLARDENGDVVAVIAINYGKRRVEFRIGKDRFEPVPFEKVTEDGTWLGQAAKPLANLLKMTESTLIKRIFDAVNK
ncbi:MAG TPA: hypothetical protein VFL86_05820, partial [Burkholderiaceae bacterium]|nr:hypothetical protein [Burkholderiaceae bacterium]